MTTETGAVAFCPNCGAAASSGRFCSTCGHDLGLQGGAPAIAAPSVEASGTAVDWSGIVVLIAGSLAILGSFLPWITATAPLVGTITRNGIDGGGDGVITIVAGILIVLLGIALLARSGGRTAARIGTVLGAVVLGGIAWVDIGNVQHRIDGLDSNLTTASVGMGLIVIMLAAVLAFVGVFLPGRRQA